MHWAREARARRARWIAWSAAAVAASILVLAGVSLVLRGRVIPGDSGPSSGQTVASVATVSGSSWILRSGGAAGEAAVPLRSGDPIPAGAIVATGRGASLAMQDSIGRSIRLAEGSRLRYVSGNASVLEDGLLYADAGRGNEPVLTIETAYGRVRDLGTQFEVKVGGGSIRIRVREGSVSLDSAGATHEVAAGNQLAWTGQGEAEYEAIPIFGASWRWAEEIAPLRDLRGRTAREFLDWISRERGWSLEFESPEVAKAAGEITLGGSITGLSLDESLDAVLPTCGMRYQLHEGVLKVSRSPAPETGA